MRKSGNKKRKKDEKLQMNQAGLRALTEQDLEQVQGGSNSTMQNDVNPQRAIQK